MSRWSAFPVHWLENCPLTDGVRIVVCSLYLYVSANVVILHIILHVQAHFLFNTCGKPRRRQKGGSFRKPRWCC